MDDNGIHYQIVDSPGEDELSQMMSLLYMGDWVSYYLALLYDVNPTAVEVIGYLKKRLKYS